MRILLQRVSNAKVTVGDRITGEIGAGLLVFVGFSVSDDETHFSRMIEKIVNLRIFDDENGRPDRSLADTGGAMLIVSQFTLYADCRKGRRPSWSGAMPPDGAEKLYDRFVECVRSSAPEMKVETGQFGAMMDVALVNDGPVTIWLDSSMFES